MEVRYTCLYNLLFRFITCYRLTLLINISYMYNRGNALKVTLQGHTSRSHGKVTHTHNKSYEQLFPDYTNSYLFGTHSYILILRMILQGFDGRDL